jgi:CBS domain-containing protein
MERHEFLEDAAKRAPTDPVEISIRDLIRYWGAQRRGYWIVEEVQRDLKKVRLTTEPPFTEGWIDITVKLVPVARKAAAGTRKASSSSEASAAGGDDVLPDASLRIGSLPSANLGVTSISPSHTLETAQSLMLSHDYSQLAVMSDARNLRGAVSWESIAQAKILNPGAELRAAIKDAEVVRASDDLLSKIPRIMEAGFVFVQARDNTISGIVTTADLSEQFATLASPFLLLAEIERRLRRIIGRSFASDDLGAVADPTDTGREVSSPDDLTLGEYVRLLEFDQRWAKLGWALDRKVFILHLQEVRSIRNEVMHFSPDPPGKAQINKLESFLKWIRRLDVE